MIGRSYEGPDILAAAGVFAIAALPETRLFVAPATTPPEIAVCPLNTSVLYLCGG